MYLLHFNIEVLLFQPDYTLKIPKVVNIFKKVTVKKKNSLCNSKYIYKSYGKKSRGFGYTCTELMGNQ